MQYTLYRAIVAVTMLLCPPSEAAMIIEFGWVTGYYLT